MRQNVDGIGSDEFLPFLTNGYIGQITVGRMYIDNMKVWMRPFDNDRMRSMYEQGKYI